MSSSFRYQSFVAVSGNLGGKALAFDDVLSSHEQEIYPITLLDENCVEFEFQTARNYYVDLRDVLLGFETETCQGLWLRNLQWQRSKKEHIEEAKVDEENTAETKSPVPLVTYVHNILHSVFSNVEMHINNQQV